MDLVIPYMHSPKEELKFTLRGFEKYYTGIDRLFIVGDKPELKNFTHVPWHQDEFSPKVKERNIYHKILRACNEPEVSSNFLMASDDHFLLRPFDDMPYFQKGELLYSWDKLSDSNPYRTTLVNTYDALVRKNLKTIHFNCHAPIIYNKEKFKEILPSFDWTRGGGYAIKSLYCNSLGVRDTPYRGVKIKFPLNIHDLKKEIVMLDMFSASNDAFNSDMVTVLKQLFPKKSRWEI